MSTRIKTQIGEKTCDGCGKVVEVELAVNEGSAEFDSLSELLSKWYKVGRRVYIPAQGRCMDLQAEACSLECVPAAAVKLALPPAEEDSTIDLNSLRTGSMGAN